VFSDFFKCRLLCIMCLGLCRLHPRWPLPPPSLPAIYEEVEEGFPWAVQPRRIGQGGGKCIVPQQSCLLTGATYTRLSTLPAAMVGGWRLLRSAGCLPSVPTNAPQPRLGFFFAKNCTLHKLAPASQLTGTSVSPKSSFLKKLTMFCN